MFNSLISSRLRWLACAFLFALVCSLFVQPARAQQNLSLSGNIIGSCGTATAAGGAATLANKCGVITSEALTTLGGSDYTLTITNTAIAAADLAFASVQNGTNTGGAPYIRSVTPGAGSLVIVVRNGHQTGSTILNGTLVIKYWNMKP